MKNKHNGSTYNPNHFRFYRSDPSGKWSPIYEPEREYRLALLDYAIIVAAAFMLAWLLTGCAEPLPVLLSEPGQSMVWIDGETCEIAGSCPQHSDMDSGTIYHQSMVHQPDNEAKHVEFFNDEIRLTP